MYSKFNQVKVSLLDKQIFETDIGLLNNSTAPFRTESFESDSAIRRKPNHNLSELAIKFAKELQDTKYTKAQLPRKKMTNRQFIMAKMFWKLRLKNMFFNLPGRQMGKFYSMIYKLKKLLFCRVLQEHSIHGELLDEMEGSRAQFETRN